jgi:hypothetical protein
VVVGVALIRQRENLKLVGRAQYSPTLPAEFPKPREKSKEIRLKGRGMTFAKKTGNPACSKVGKMTLIDR